MKRAMLWLVVVSALALAGGCGKDKNGESESRSRSKPLPEADTPKQVVTNMHTALRNGNKDALVACFDAAPEEKELLEAAADFILEVKAFQDAMVDAYGRESVEGDNEELVAMFQSDWVDKMTFEITGDTATATHPDEDEPLELVRKDGVWKVKVDKLQVGAEDENEDPAEAIKMMEGMVKIYRETRPNVGAEGYTAERVKEELSTRMMQLMMKHMDKD